MDLHHALAKSAERYAKRALEAFVNDDDPDFFLFAGVAVEHALKARLVNENPAFLAPLDKAPHPALLLHGRARRLQQALVTAPCVAPDHHAVRRPPCSTPRPRRPFTGAATPGHPTPSGCTPRPSGDFYAGLCPMPATSC